jgi:hypothetical protein
LSCADGCVPRVVPDLPTSRRGGHCLRICRLAPRQWKATLPSASVQAGAASNAASHHRVRKEAGESQVHWAHRLITSHSGVGARDGIVQAPKCMHLPCILPAFRSLFCASALHKSPSCSHHSPPLPRPIRFPSAMHDRPSRLDANTTRYQHTQHPGCSVLTPRTVDGWAARKRDHSDPYQCPAQPVQSLV